MKIVSIKKFIRSITIVLLIIVGLSLIISKSSYSRGEKQYKTIYVSKGDTLWSIAKSNQDSNEYYKGKDIRYIMNDITQINNIVKFKDIFNVLKDYDAFLVAYEKEKENTLKKELIKLKEVSSPKVAVLIGPEGGIDDEEIKILKTNNTKIITLGKRILRTETAPLAISSIIQYELEK